jgi:hypothetical protein
MTMALCLNCGEIKFGAVCPCPNCQVCAECRPGPQSVAASRERAPHFAPEVRECGALTRRRYNDSGGGVGLVNSGESDTALMSFVLH